MYTNLATTRLVCILPVIMVLILPKGLASDIVAPGFLYSMPASGVENDKQIVNKPEAKDTPISESYLKAVMSSFIKYYGVSGEFIHGFIATLSVIIVSELGDNTFFIAAIMAMRHSRLAILSGAVLANSIMHVISVVFGVLALNVIPKAYTHYISAILFAIFGLKMLKESYYMSPENAQEEMEEVQEELRKKDEERKMNDDVEGELLGSPTKRTAGVITNILRLLFSPIFLQAFTMTFLAEWGDRSQLATIVLAAREDMWAVIIAGIIGHSLCTGLAVLGGRFVAQRISVRTVTLVGAIVFILFALTALSTDPYEGNQLDSSLVSGGEAGN